MKKEKKAHKSDPRCAIYRVLDIMTRYEIRELWYMIQYRSCQLDKANYQINL